MTASTAPETTDAYESERVEALAWEDLAAAATLSSAPLRAARDGEVVMLSSPLSYGLFNRVIGLGTLARTSTVELQRVLASYRRSESDPVVHVGESPDRDWLVSELNARNFRRYPRSWLKLARGAGMVQGARTTLEIAGAHGHEAREAGEVLARALGLPNSAAAVFACVVGRPRWHLLVARDAGKVVAAASLFVAESSGYLLAAGTLPSHRGRGAQAALIERRIRVALALGCTRLFCETGEAIEGRPQTSGDNLLRAGFRPLLLRENWVRPGTSP